MECIGPFNLSLAALADDQAELKSLFLERKSEFSWHPELMMPDVTMQTSFLKDLVTGVDPKSSYTYLNYLLENQLLYSFSKYKAAQMYRGKNLKATPGGFLQD